MKNIAIFASGSGTNAQNIIEYFEKSDKISVVLVLSNKKDAYVLERAKKLKVPNQVFNRDEFYNSDRILNVLNSNQPLCPFPSIPPQNGAISLKEPLLEEYPNAH